MSISTASKRLPSPPPCTSLDPSSSHCTSEGPKPSGGTSRDVRAVIREQFATEVKQKEEELEMIEGRIHLAKMLLQRLRLGVLAQHYGVSAFYPTALDYREDTIGVQHNWETFEEEFVGQQDSNADSARPEGVTDAAVKSEEIDSDLLDSDMLDSDLAVVDVAEVSAPEGDKMQEEHDEQKEEAAPMETTPPAPPTNAKLSDENESCQESRFYYKKRVIIGNTSQFLDPAAHHGMGDGSTHKWMVYVRGSQEEPDISHFVKAVRFFLHPSYHPNDIVRVDTPPFHLTHLGWGEFPVRVQLEFTDKANKSVDIIHNLVLDRTHTGQQTLGAETVVDLDIVAPPPEEGKCLRLNGISRTVEKGARSSTSPLSFMDSSSLLPPLSPDSAAHGTHLDQELSTGSSTPTTVLEKTTPTSVSPVVVSVLTTNLDKCLHNAVRTIPIHGKAVPSEDFYIPAPSLAQFRQWHIGRRRATEWERAVAIRRSIERKLRVPSLLSTKQVMQWCRQNGYTPLDPVPACGRGFCKVCGCQLEAGLEEEEADWGGDERNSEGAEGLTLLRRCPEVHEHCQVMMFGRHGLPLRGNSMDPFEELHPNAMDVDDTIAPLPKLCSLTQPHELVTNMFSRQTVLEEHEEQQEEEVDVYTLPPSPSCARSRALVDLVPRFRVPQTPELKWVQQASASLGVHIYPAVIDRMYAHVVEHMIYISCARFLRGILGQAVQGAGQMLEGKLSQDRILTPFHVQQALMKLEHCDFLSNQHLGLRPNPLEKGSIAATSSTAVSESESSTGSSDEGEPEGKGGREH